MMRVLVTAATKYGATTEIAQAIAETLGEHGLEATILPPEQVEGVDGYDAVVLGSAVYAGHWLKPARELVERHAAALAGLPVWLFSSGPVGDPPKPEEDPVDVAELQGLTNAREHRVFAGKLVRKQLSFPERAIASALRVPEGDFRDWTEIRQWAAGIAEAMGAGSSPLGRTGAVTTWADRRAGNLMADGRHEESKRGVRHTAKEVTQMAGRSALGRAPHKTAGGLLLAAGATIVMGIITAEALYTASYNARMEISDLGASETGIVLQPSATIFNATMLVAGAMIIAGTWFAHQAFHRRVVTIPTGLLGIGAVGVGIFPGNIHPQHLLLAFTAFVAGGLAVLLSAKVTPQPLRAIFASMGAISLSFTLASVFLLEWGPFARLGLGGVERWMVYPVLLWLVGFGSYLMAGHTAEASGAPLPDTAARSLEGHKGREGVRSSR